MGSLTVQKIKELAKPGRYGDASGLYLNIAKTGTKSWVQRIWVEGRRLDKGLGGYPKVSLAKARKVADANRVAVKQGRNPWTEPSKPVISVAAEMAAIPTLREAAYRVHDNDCGGRPASAGRWIGRLESHIIPKLGDTPVDEITRAELSEIIGPLRRSNHETARKTKQALHDVFKWAVAYGFRVDNPADDALEVLLPKLKADVEHRPALHHSEVRSAVHKIRHSEARAATKLAFEFLILTAARSGEVRHATWAEIQGDTWVIPAARMKAKRDHRVPLSWQAQTVLRRARELYREPDDSDFDWPVEVSPDAVIFPHPGSFKPLSENALSDRAKKSALSCVPHGFRSSFRDWAAELSGASWECIELSLAHKVGTSVEAAYFRTDLMDERRPLMEAWADYTDPTPPPF